MNTAQPIRSRSELTKFKNYYVTKDYNPRNFVLITISLNTALRISDVLSLRWKDVYNTGEQRFRSHILLKEQKTDKISRIYINKSIRHALSQYREELPDEQCSEECYLFTGKNGQALSRAQAYRIVRKAAQQCGISGTISPHSLRKTFGYFAWKSGVPPAMLMSIFNHSSFSVTRRYLGIEQDDRDDIFKNMCL